MFIILVHLVKFNNGLRMMKHLLSETLPWSNTMIGLIKWQPGFLNYLFPHVSQEATA